MVELLVPVTHGPHFWYCRYWFSNSDVYFDFWGKGDRRILTVHSLNRWIDISKPAE